MKSAGMQMRSYCYVLDCASAILTVLLNGKSGDAYNISNKASVCTISDIALIACVAVVGLHTFPKDLSLVTASLYYLCGFAVPFFFMSSGYFLLNRGELNVLESSK